MTLNITNSRLHAFSPHLLPHLLLHLLSSFIVRLECLASCIHSTFPDSPLANDPTRKSDVRTCIFATPVSMSANTLWAKSPRIACEHHHLYRVDATVRTSAGQSCISGRSSLAFGSRWRASRPCQRLGPAKAVGHGERRVIEPLNWWRSDLLPNSKLHHTVQFDQSLFFLLSLSIKKTSTSTSIT